VRRFAVRGRAGTEGLVALGNQVRRARVAYAGFDVGTPAATFAAAVAGDSLVAGGFTLDSVDVRATYRQAPGSAAQGTALASVYQDEGRSYSVRGDYGLYADRTELRFADLRLRFDTTVYRSTRPGAVRFGARGVEVDEVELVNGVGGRIAVDGRLPERGDADLRAQVENVEVADVLGLLESDVAFRGRASVDARLTGPLAAPVIAGTAALTNGNYNGTRCPTWRPTCATPPAGPPPPRRPRCRAGARRRARTCRGRCRAAASSWPTRPCRSTSPSAARPARASTARRR
jgi:hypothetical protein